MNAEFNYERWFKLWNVTEAKGDPQSWFDQLLKHYSEFDRYYHNSEHIGHCLKEFDSASYLAHQPVVVELALWFHDAIYDTHASDNEEQSALLSERCLSEIKVSESIIDSVKKLIHATKHHDKSLEPDAPLMVDIDLSILGQSEDRFSEYEAQIRNEYQWVPEDIFNPKRSEILKGFLDRPRIFETEFFNTKYEAQARKNIEASLCKLRGKRQ